MTCDPSAEHFDSRKLATSSLWKSKKMIEDGCTLSQTLQVMQERCKDCDPITPMQCTEECETWKVKNELNETYKLVSKRIHGLSLLNAIKNERRLAILQTLNERPLHMDELQRKLRNSGYSHSRKTLDQYLKPLFNASLIRNEKKRLVLTLYGRKINNLVKEHDFDGKLPIHSSGYEEQILRSLLDSPKTRSDLVKTVPPKSLSRTLKRLRESGVISNDSPSDHILYFRTKRALHMERLSPTQKSICRAIPETGLSARSLSRTVGINLRRTYKYLRSLRGKKLLFRRKVRHEYDLTDTGRSTAKFLEAIASIE
jgi:DNA-binding HxlR family transcriptional regulator